MADFVALDRLIASQHPSYPSAASYLAYIGTPSTSMADLSLEGQITSHIITSTEKDDVNTLFQAGSISKPITALAVMRLVDQGKIKVGDPIATYLPETIINAIAGDEATRELMKHITIELLLRHRAGLGVHGFVGYAPPSDTGHCELNGVNGNGKRKIDHDYRPSAAEIITGGRGVNSLRVGLQFFPGQGHSYSGGGYTVLQLILETVCKTDFPSLMKELVLDPIGMKHSTYEFAEKWVGQGELRRSSAYSTGYTPAPSEYHDLAELAAAGLWTTPSDLLKAIKAVQDSLLRDEGGFLTKETARAMLTPAPEGDEGYNTKYGLGWVLDDYGFGHDGSNDPGWVSTVWGSVDMSFRKKKEDENVNGTKENKGKDQETSEEQESEEEKEAERLLKEKIANGLTGRGRCIMTNSAAGYYSMLMMLPALAQVSDWPTPLSWGYIANGSPISFAARDKRIDETWKDWIGQWGEKEDWAIIENDGLPHLKFKELPALKLVPAASPVHEYVGGKQGIDFVVDGLDMQNMVRLGWKKNKKQDESRIIEVWNFKGKDIFEKKKEDAEKEEKESANGKQNGEDSKMSD